MEQARAAIEVTAGLIPGQPVPEFTRRWAITSAEWQEANRLDDERATDFYGATSTGNVLADRQGAAMAYAQLLMFQPDRVNWVRVDWVWF